MHQDPLPLLGLSRERKLCKELTESHIQRIALEVEITQVLLGYSSAKVVATIQVIHIIDTTILMTRD